MEVAIASAAGWSGTSEQAPATAEQHYRCLGEYLTAVQRQDTDAANRLVRQVGGSHPTDAPVLYEALRVTAEKFTVEAPDRDA